MESKFINQYQVTLEMAEHWSKHPVGENAVRTRRKVIRLRVLFICCGPLFMLSGALTQEYYMILLGIFTVAWGFARLFLRPQRAVKKQYAMALKAQKTDVWINTFTFADEIVYESDNTCARYAYSDIVKVSEDSEYFYLFYNEDMMLTIYKPGFILGTAEDFRAFCKSFIQ